MQILEVLDSPAKTLLIQFCPEASISSIVIEKYKKELSGMELEDLGNVASFTKVLEALREGSMYGDRFILARMPKFRDFSGLVELEIEVKKGSDRVLVVVSSDLTKDMTRFGCVSEFLGFSTKKEKAKWCALLCSQKRVILTEIQHAKLMDSCGDLVTLISTLRSLQYLSYGREFTEIEFRKLLNPSLEYLDYQTPILTNSLKPFMERVKNSEPYPIIQGVIAVLENLHNYLIIRDEAESEAYIVENKALARRKKLWFGSKHKYSPKRVRDVLEATQALQKYVTSNSDECWWEQLTLILKGLSSGEFSIN